MTRPPLFLLCLLVPLVASGGEPWPYLEQFVRTAEQSLAAEVPDKAAWLANRDRYRRELKEMLGLDPEPPRGDLKPVIAGVVAGEGIVVEKLHFQSLPGLYVTANFYRPAVSDRRLPTVLYLSGHGPTYGPDGRSCGNKASYQHHGIWFARHGYNCLILDTVQWGEIPGEHWGTYQIIHESTRRIYDLLDAGNNLGLQIAEGPHQDMQPLNIGAFHWFERFLKGRDRMDVIQEPAVKAFKAEELRVFDELPADEINTRVDESFVPLADPPVPQTREEWGRMGDGWIKVLRETMPDLKPLPDDDRFSWAGVQGSGLHGPAMSTIKGLIGATAGSVTVHVGAEVAEAFLHVAPTGSGRHMMFVPAVPLAWGCDGEFPRESTHKLRRYILAGAAPDAIRCRETVRACARLKEAGALRAVRGCQSQAVIALLAELDGRLGAPLELFDLPPGFRGSVSLPGILKHFDIPQAVAMAAEQTKVRVTGRREDWTWAAQTAGKMGFGQNLEIVPALEVLEVRKIWDAAPHNAFTSLIEYNGEWFVTFREGSGHVPGTDGAIRVLVAKDGGTWESNALLTEAGVDLRDPKFCRAPDGRLMLTIGGSVYDGTSAAGARRKRTAARTRTAFSADGRTWTAPLPACDDGQWLWRSTLHDGTLYGVAYTVADENKFKLSLWSSPDGARFSRVTNLDPGRNVLPNESTVRFAADGTLLVLTRNENRGRRGHAMFGTSRPPYKSWSWTDTGQIIQGPDFLRLADGRMIYGGRDLVDGRPTTTLGVLTATGLAMPMLVLPSGGDCSYPGLAEGPDGQVWASYYSSHEGKAAIYLAKLKPAR